ncbi:hypothetical protein D3C87_1280400 [compost metagenome]
MSLKPEEEKNLRLNISVPSNLVTEKLQLFVNVPQISSNDSSKDTTGKDPSGSGKETLFTYPVGIFAVPEASPLQNTTGIEQLLQTNNGQLGLTLSNIQRLPWSDGDLISAKVTIANKSNKTVVLPDLVGQFTIDSAKLTSDTKLINTQSVALLGAGKSTDFYVVSKLPSYLDFSQLQISLLEKSGDAAAPVTSPWFQFTNLGSLPALNTIKKDSSYQLLTGGNKEEFKIRKTIVYPGLTSDIVYTEVEVNNKEDHQIDLSQLVGYYKAAGGQNYRAKTVQVETPLGPDEKSVVVLWTKIPGRINVPDMKLILGEGITDNKLTPIKGEPTGYINAASMELNVQKPTSIGTLKGISVFPYVLDLNSVDAVLSGSTSVQVKLDYKLIKDSDYTVGDLGHKFIFELKDTSTGRTFEQEVTPETDLKIGANHTFSFNINDTVFDKMKYGSYYLSVYDAFQGEKILLANQGFYYNRLNISSEDK